LVGFETRTVCEVPVATNEYQTSSFVPTAEHEGAVPDEGVAPAVVPETGLEHEFVDETDRTTAAEQSSFAGEVPVTIQISNVAVVVTVAVVV